MSSLRPRQVDLLKVMSWHEEAPGDSGVARAVGDLATGMEKDDENEKHINLVLRSRTLSSIPCPKCVRVPSYDTDSYDTWDRPERLMPYSAPPDDEYDRRAEPLGEYDIDEEDQVWLDKHCPNGSPVDATTFELIIEAWERAAFRHDGVPLSADNQPRPMHLAPLPQVLYDLPLSEAREVALRVAPGLAAHIADAIYAHWQARRAARSTGGNLLLHRYRYGIDKNAQDYWDCEPVRDPEAHRRVRKLTMLVRQCEQLQKEMQAAREIAEKVVQRENLKRDIISVAAKIVLRRLADAGALATLPPSPAAALNAAISSSSDEEGSVFGYQDAITLQSWVRRVRQIYLEPSGSIHAPPASAPQPVSTPAPSAPAAAGIVAEPLSRRRKRSPEGEAGQEGQTEPPRVARRVTATPDGMITLRGVGSFRGRARMGRGGRILFDRFVLNADGDAVLEATMPMGQLLELRRPLDVAAAAAAAGAALAVHAPPPAPTPIGVRDG